MADNEHEPHVDAPNNTQNKLTAKDGFVLGTALGLNLMAVPMIASPHLEKQKNPELFEVREILKDIPKDPKHLIQNVDEAIRRLELFRDKNTRIVDISAPTSDAVIDSIGAAEVNQNTRAK